MARVARAPSTTIAARVSPDIAAALQRVAEREDRTASQIVARILRAEMERLGEIEPKQSKSA